MDTNASSLNSASSNLTGKSNPAGYRGLGVMLTLGLAAWFGAGVVGVAHADSPPQTIATAQVTYADLDVSTEAGARTLLARIDGAARDACGDAAHSPLLPREGANIRECVNEAVGTAVSKIGSPMVASLHGKTIETGVTLAAR